MRASGDQRNAWQQLKDRSMEYLANLANKATLGFSRACGSGRRNVGGLLPVAFIDA
jgi:hypothetical protein